MWWHPQVEAAQPELCGLSSQDRQSRRRRVSHCCRGNTLPDESNSTYYFVPHSSTWRHLHTQTCTVAMRLCVKNTLWVKEIHWIVSTLIFSLPSHLFFSRISFLSWGSIPPTVPLLRCAKVNSFHRNRLRALVSNPSNDLYAVFAYMCTEKHYCPSLLFPHSMLIILCNINYSDQPMLIRALIPVNIRTLQKPSSILEQTIDTTRLLQPLDVYVSLMWNSN